MEELIQELVEAMVASATDTVGNGYPDWWMEKEYDGQVSGLTVLTTRSRDPRRSRNGGEYDFWECKYHYHKLHGNFFTAVYFRNWQEWGFAWDQSYMIGYKWSKIQGVGRTIRIAADYHKGFSLEGQFMKRRTSYWEIKFMYGF